MFCCKMTDLVECHSGFEYAERPVALHWQGVRLVVADILNCRRTPSGKSFRIRTPDEQIFKLCYHELNDEWCIEPSFFPVEP